MDLASLNSLKVADLKQLLKARSLSLVGNKSDLIQRLEAAMLTDPVGNGTAAVSSAKIIEREIDEDAILADDDESFSKPDDSLLHNEDLLLSESSIVPPNNANQAAPKVVPSQPKPTSAIAGTVNHATAPEAVAIAPIKQTNPVSTVKPTTTTTKNILLVDEKKQARSLKFADPKLKNRSERFGVPLPSAIPPEIEKIKQRANRFGEVVSEKGKSLDEKNRLEKRKERFGFIESTTTPTTKRSNGINATVTPIVQEKIQKRQERFGVVSNEGDKNKILPGFKRRRFAN